MRYFDHDESARNGIIRSMYPSEDALTNRVIGSAIEVHRYLGPGLLESTYEECLALELGDRGLAFRRQALMPVIYKGTRLDAWYRVDFLLDGLVVEVKAVEKILPVHEAQLLTYMALLDKPCGLLLNFHTPVLKDGIRRLALKGRGIRDEGGTPTGRQ